MISATQAPRAVVEVPQPGLVLSGTLETMPEFILSKTESGEAYALLIEFDKFFNVVVSRHMPADNNKKKHDDPVPERPRLDVAGGRLVDALWALDPDIDYVQVTPFEPSGLPAANKVFIRFLPNLSKQIAWTEFGEQAVRKIAEVINDEKLRLSQPAVLSGVLMTFGELRIKQSPIFILPPAGQAPQA